MEPLVAQFGLDKIQTLQADLSNERDVAHLFTQASSSFGPTQVIIVNHAIYVAVDTPLVQMSLDQWKSTIDINLNSSFLVAREFLRGLETASESMKAHASIVFIGSSAGKFGTLIYLIYLEMLKPSSNSQEKRNMPTMLLQKAVRLSEPDAPPEHVHKNGS